MFVMKLLLPGGVYWSLCGLLGKNVTSAVARPHPRLLCTPRSTETQEQQRANVFADEKGDRGECGRLPTCIGGVKAQTTRPCLLGL